MATTLFDLQGKIALVTGASRGIGESIAKLLGEQGAHVIVSSRKLDDCQSVADSIIAAGGSAEALACHVGSMDDIANCFAHIKSAHGKLDILINNAATNPYFGDILDTDLGAYTKTVDVNIRGYFFMCIEGGKLMRDNGGGQIQTAFNNARDQAGLGQDVTPHVIRHTWATWFYAVTRDYGRLLDLGGWRTTSVAERYRKIAPADQGEKVLAAG